ncbi:hypothetical protein GCM10009596_09640 [Arthrobacter rhombi]|uniref:hypothetical protein n=1 Tax=Arthrobacter rhombi TaxID=71253 RepID=UPI0031E46A35
MLDPLEGLDAHGFITTGVRRDRVPPTFEPLLDQACAGLSSALPSAVAPGQARAGLYLYGSVATGRAVSGVSDVDLFTIGLPSDVSTAVARQLSSRHAGLCRAVEIGAAQPEDFVGTGDAAYGNRVFLRHYCLPLLGAETSEDVGPFRGDLAAARGFNGDIGSCLERWRQLLAEGATASLGRRIARKTLLAVAGLVSVHDATWTTDRMTSAKRWSLIRPDLAPPLLQLAAWAEGISLPAASDVRACLEGDGVVPAVVDDFRRRIGLWS